MFKAGDWAGAEAAYTRALELDSTSAPAWGNRSAARLKRGRAADALADAVAAIAARRDYVRGYERQGAALEALGRMAEARAAYAAGLAVAPSGGADAAALASLRGRLRDLDARPAGGDGNAPASPPARTGTVVPAWARAIDTVRDSGRIVMLICALFALLLRPFGGQASNIAFKVIQALGLVLHILLIIREAGLPRWDTEVSARRDRGGMGVVDVCVCVWGGGLSLVAVSHRCRLSDICSFHSRSDRHAASPHATRHAVRSRRP